MTKPNGKKGGKKVWVLRESQAPAKPARKLQTFAPVRRTSAPKREYNINKSRAPGKRLAASKEARGAYKAASNMGAMKRLMYNFISPCDAHGFRWPYEGESSAPAAVRTGAVNLHRVQSLTAPTSGYAGTYSSGDKGTALFYSFRNPLRAAVILGHTTLAATYNGTFTNGTTTWTPPVSNTNLALPIGFFTAASTSNAPHTNYFYTGSLESDRAMGYIWLGVGDKLNVTTTGTGTPSDYWTTWMVDLPGSVGAQEITTSAAPVHVTTITTTTVFTAVTPGYYGLRVTTGSASPTWSYSVSVVVAAGDVLCHYPVPDAQNHAIYFKYIRLLASSMLISNVASTLNVEGVVYAGLITDGTPFYNYNTPDSLTTLLTDFYDGPNAKGLYAWLKPTSNSFTYRQALWTTNGNVVDSSYSLDDGSGYEVAIIRSAGQSGTYPALDFLVTLHYALEFHTDDPWRELEFSPYNVKDATEALQVACRMATFTHNPIHLAQIRQFVGRATSFLRKHSAVIGQALATMFPEYSGALVAAGAALQRVVNNKQEPLPVEGDGGSGFFRASFSRELQPVLAPVGLTYANVYAPAPTTLYLPAGKYCARLRVVMSVPTHSAMIFLSCSTLGTGNGNAPTSAVDVRDSTTFEALGTWSVLVPASDVCNSWLLKAIYATPNQKYWQKCPVAGAFIPNTGSINFLKDGFCSLEFEVAPDDFTSPTGQVFVYVAFVQLAAFTSFTGSLVLEITAL